MRKSGIEPNRTEKEPYWTNMAAMNEDIVQRPGGVLWGGGDLGTHIRPECCIKATSHRPACSFMCTRVEESSSNFLKCIECGSGAYAGNVNQGEGYNWKKRWNEIHYKVVACNRVN